MWKKLTDFQKEEYRNYCDNRFGKTCVSCESGEPMYMDQSGGMINTSVFIQLFLYINPN